VDREELRQRPQAIIALQREMLMWLASRPRTYAEAIEAWKSFCPRHPVWDEALLEGLIRVDHGESMAQSKVVVTPKGRAVINA
jgi:hypothetical protein